MDPGFEGIPRIDAGSLDGKGDLNSVHSAVIRVIYLLRDIRDHGFGDCDLANQQAARRINVEPLGRMPSRRRREDVCGGAIERIFFPDMKLLCKLPES